MHITSLSDNILVEIFLKLAISRHERDDYDDLPNIPRVYPASDVQAVEITYSFNTKAIDKYP